MVLRTAVVMLDHLRDGPCLVARQRSIMAVSSSAQKLLDPLRPDALETPGGLLQAPRAAVGAPRQQDYLARSSPPASC